MRRTERIPTTQSSMRFCIALCAALVALGCETQHDSASKKPPTSEASPTIGSTTAPADLSSSQVSKGIAESHPDELVGDWYQRTPDLIVPFQPRHFKRMTFEVDGTYRWSDLYLPEGDQTDPRLVEKYFELKTGTWGVREDTQGLVLCLTLEQGPPECRSYRVSRVFDDTVEEPTFRKVLSFGQDRWKQAK